jgi:hypothetical protein
MDPHFSLLPFELVEQILQCYNLQFLDVTTLRICSLVCRLWNFPAQRILFRVIDIVKELQWYGMLILLANSPHLSPLVEVLRMSVQPHYMFPEDFAMLPKLLPAVTTLYIRGVHPKTRILQNIPQLRILHVCDIPTKAPRQMCHRPEFGAPLIHHPALEELHYAESGAFGLIEWWLSTTMTHYHQTLRAATLSMRLRGTTSQAKTQRLQNFLAHYDKLDYLHLKIETYGQCVRILFYIPPIMLILIADGMHDLKEAGALHPFGVSDSTSGFSTAAVFSPTCGPSLAGPT